MQECNRNQTCPRKTLEIMMEIIRFGGIGSKSGDRSSRSFLIEMLPSYWLYQFMIISIIWSLFYLYPGEKIN